MSDRLVIGLILGILLTLVLILVFDVEDGKTQTPGFIDPNYQPACPSPYTERQTRGSRTGLCFKTVRIYENGDRVRVSH